MTMGVAYVVRVIILRQVGFEATGLYQSAWTLGGLYVGFILQAMGADFYPRLTASITTMRGCNRLVNEQTLSRVAVGGSGRTRHAYRLPRSSFRCSTPPNSVAAVGVCVGYAWESLCR